MMASGNRLVDYLVRLGPMRVALMAIALTLAILIPTSGSGLGDTGFDVIRGIIVPTLTPIVFMVLMLDVLMSAVHRADSRDEAVRARYRMIIRTHLLTTAVLVLAALPFFIDLLSD